MDLAEWNPTAGKRWNHLLTLMQREWGSRPDYFRPVETQKRGGLHKHPLMRTRYGIDEKRFRQLAIQAGFGHEVKVIRVDKGSRAVAQYVTKRVAGYVTKSADERADVPWRVEKVDRCTGEVTESTDATYRTWSQSRSWGTTMAAIRTAAREKAQQLEALRSPKLFQAGTVAGAELGTTDSSPPRPDS